MSHLTLINKIPFTEIFFCGNRIYETGKLIVQRGIEPIIIANGIKPRIWLTVFLENGDTFSLVEDSKSKHESITVDMSPSHVIIYNNNDLIFRGMKTSTDSFHVDLLDLRSLGITVFGDSDALNVNGMRLASSVIKGCGSLVSLG